MRTFKGLVPKAQRSAQYLTVLDVSVVYEGTMEISTLMG